MQTADLNRLLGKMSVDRHDPTASSPQQAAFRPVGPLLRSATCRGRERRASQRRQGIGWADNSGPGRRVLWYEAETLDATAVCIVL